MQPLKYAIKINVDEGTVAFSKSIKDEIKRFTVINFAYSENGFSFYLSKKTRPQTKFRYKIDPETQMIKNSTLADDLAHTLYFNLDWIAEYSKGNFTIKDKIHGKREYLICVEKLADGCFRSLYSLYYNLSLRSKQPARRNIYDRSNLLLFENGEVVQKYFYDYFKATNHPKNRDNFMATSVKYRDSQYDSTLEADVSMIIGSKDYQAINTSERFMILTPFEAERSNSRTIELLRIKGNYKFSTDYLYERVEYIDKEVVVTFLSYNRLLAVHYRDGVRLDDITALHKSSKRQSIKLTKYIQAVYPDLTSDQVKIEADKIEFIYKPLDPIIKEVTGDEIVYWYDEDNYFTELKGSNSLLSSCMRYKKCAPWVQFYADNPDVCSMLVLIIQDKLIGRALIWKGVDGVRMMDRPYVNRDQELLYFEKYRKENNIEFIYDYKKRTDSGNGYGPSNFEKGASKKFEIEISKFPKSLVREHSNKMPFSYQTQGTNDVPYLDNFFYFDLNRSIITTDRSNRETYYKEHPDLYFKCNHSGDWIFKNNVVLIDDRPYHKVYTVLSKHYNKRILISTSIQLRNGDYVNKTDAIRYNNEWILKEEHAKIIAEQELVTKADKVKIKVLTIEDEIRLLNQEELEYVDEIRVA